MKVVGTFAAARELVAGVVGLVPTMGFLHEGHLALVDVARRECDTVVMSLFVNPLQFDEARDLSRYPRNPGRDAQLAEERGVDILFAPELEEMYPRRQLTRVTVANVTEDLEGAFRPGHFEGVTTVVTKLLTGIRADRAYFGRKDAQQLITVTRMAFDLSMPVEVVPVSIVRESDGLALSSRNVFLSREDRDRALGISAGLMAAAGAAEDGERSAEELELIVAGYLGDLEVDYVTLADGDSVQPVRRLEQDAFLAVAARAGNTRLIDNVFFRVTSAGIEADRGNRLEGPSILYGGS
jgi:pantoate--beta-alanine ligase